MPIVVSKLSYFIRGLWITHGPEHCSQSILVPTLRGTVVVDRGMMSGYRRDPVCHYLSHHVSPHLVLLFTS